MPTLDIPQSSRMDFIGGSDIAAILGISPWTTPYALWEEKVYGITEEISRQRAGIFDWGKRLEPYVMEELIEKHDLQIVFRNRIWSLNAGEYAGTTLKAYPWMRAEIDLEFFDGDDLANGDVKTASVFGKEGWGPDGSDEVPSYYVAQFQWGMMHSGAKVCLCAVLFGANDLRLYRIYRDDAIIEYLHTKAVQFWNNHVLARNPPPIVNAEDAEKLMAKFDGITLTCTPELKKALRTLNGVKKAIKRLESVEEATSGKLKTALALGLEFDGNQTPGNTAIVEEDGTVLMTWNPQSAKRVDVGALKEKYPSIHEEVTKSSTFRVMRIKEKYL